MSNELMKNLNGKSKWMEFKFLFEIRREQKTMKKYTKKNIKLDMQFYSHHNIQKIPQFNPKENNIRKIKC